jgi:hypothetical protein
MSIFLGAVKKDLVRRRVSFEESEKIKTKRLTQIERKLRQYFWSRYDSDNENKNIKTMESKTYTLIKIEWSKEVEKILLKNGIEPSDHLWAYNIGDILA